MLLSCNNCDLQQAATSGDPMERALCVLAAKTSTTKTHARQLTRIAEIPFDTAHKFMATFHQQGDEIRLFVKGAPEILLQLATNDAKNPSSPYWGQNERLASQGLRVLAVAERTFPASELQSDNLFFHVQELNFVGLIGLLDPPRNGVKQAIMQCQKSGIQVKMITGDQLLTAKAIANELNLFGDVVDGAELSSMDDETLSQRIEQIAVFARTVPTQKLRIVNALQAKRHVVAMTGDGVNDAPALKSADIGIAMGITGTDVAKEAASMILLDDNFTTIVKAIKEGRGIYDNMVKFIRFQLSTNIGAILTVAAAPFLGLPAPFTAVQLLWVNIIMDGPPAMSLGVDPVRTQIMKDHPRAPNSQILSWKRLGNLLGYGITMAVGTLGILYYGLLTGSTEHAASLAYTTFIIFQVFNVFNARSEKHTAFTRHFFANKWLWTAIIAVIALQVLLIHWQPAQLIFHTYPLSLFDWCLVTAVAASVLILDELRKLLSFLISKIKPKTSHHHKQSQ
jgi:Ca2+-transporting ATPase